MEFIKHFIYLNQIFLRRLFLLFIMQKHKLSYSEYFVTFMDYSLLKIRSFYMKKIIFLLSVFPTAIIIHNYDFLYITIKTHNIYFQIACITFSINSSYFNQHYSQFYPKFMIIHLLQIYSFFNISRFKSNANCSIFLIHTRLMFDLNNLTRIIVLQ